MLKGMLTTAMAVSVAVFQSEGRPPFTMRGADFEVTRGQASSGRVEIVVCGGGELIPLTLRIGGPDRLVVSRAANGVWGLSDPEKVLALTAGRAVTAFREHIGEYERRLIAEGPGRRGEDDPQALGFLLTGALLASLAGDPAAGPRARDLVIQRLPALSEGSPRDPTGSCGAAWRDRVRQADDQRSSCLAEAERRDGWSEKRAIRTLCEAAFVADFTAGEVTLAACKRSDQF